MSETITVREAAEICRVEERTIRDWIKQGKLKAMRLGKRYRLERADVEALFQPIAATPAPKGKED